MKNNLRIREVKPGDINKILELEQKVWGEEMAAAEDKWESRLKIYPFGTLVAENDTGLVGVIVTHVINWKYKNGYFPTWDEATAGGYITNHDDNGNAMYGVDLAVLPRSPGAASKLLAEAIKRTKDKKLKLGFLGCRIPSLNRFIKKQGSREITEAIVLDCASKDREVGFFCQQGFSIIGAKKNYFPPDDDSIGWGIILKLK